jgi:cell wall-associated NlpC family hydrolase
VTSLIAQSFLFAQVSHQIIFDKKYSELPFGIRIENSGNYSAASFDVIGKDILFSSFNNSKIYNFNIEKSDFKIVGERKIINVTGDNSFSESQLNIQSEKDYPELLQKKIFKGNPTLLINKGGILNGTDGEEIKIEVEKSEKLSVDVKIPGVNFLKSINFPSNLACADLVGVDAKGNTFVVVETYLSQIPLEVKREVYTLSVAGDVLSILEIPLAKFTYTIKDLQIDADGNLYHLYSDENGIKIFFWSGLTKPVSTIIHYPVEFNKISRPKELENINEPQQEQIAGINTLASRVTALKIGESYALHQYKCTSMNLSVSDVSAPDGDIVRTPSWLVVGSNARVAYKWGGFNTLAEYDNGLANGKFAADINTDGVSSYAVGVDCSGFVSRCWQMGSHYSTSSMPAITTQYASWNDLKPGDAIHKIGHVRLFVNRNPNGTLRVVESSARGWDVSYWSYATSDLTTYTPRYYNNMETNANASQPNLLQATEIYGGIISLNWTCDTTNIIGYRVYHSVNGSSWSLLLDENTCDSTSINIGTENDVEYFRVASVKKIGDVLSESNWSNSMGIKKSAVPTFLIVDGYKRTEGSWRGAGHTFAVKYGKALQDTKHNFETVSNSKVLDGSILLNNYKVVIWISGDESTIDETFSHSEQTLLKSFLENGGSLFVSGSEIGWDLGNKGDAADKDFYKNYFKANYVSDDAATSWVSGEQNSIFTGLGFYFGQTYEEDYPDVISPIGGGVSCLLFGNGNSAGISYEGKFGTSDKIGKVIYLSFPLETTADDSAFKNILTNAVDFFTSPVSIVEEGNKNPTEFSLEQNFPNPFNPSTIISYHLSANSFVTLKVYDVLGNEVVSLVNEEKPAGIYQVEFESSASNVQLANGVYFYKLQAGSFVQTKKMVLLK